MRKITKALTVVSLLAPVSGHTLGIGDIRVRSALNQNLNAEIALVASRGENPTNIKVSLAPAEKFDEAGVPWSYFLSKIRFQPIVKPNGSMVIKVTSREALKEPYLNFLLEVSWPKGNLYREFTVLVDPPADYQHQSYQEPVYQEPAYPMSQGYESLPPMQEEYAPRPRQRHASRPRRASSAGNYGGQITVRRNDTLWNVAERARGAGVSVEQMMMALYDKNPHAFYQQNVNALSAGKRLQIPDKAAVEQLTRQDALAAFGQHNEAWNNNRSGIPAGTPQVAKEGAVDSQLQLEAPTEATVGANEQVSPSSGQTTGTTSAAPGQLTTPSPETAQQAKGSAPVNDAVQGKIAALEKQMAMMQELIALKDKQLAELQNPSQTPPTTTETPATQAVPPVPPVTPPVPPEQAVSPPVTTPPPVQATPEPPKPIQPAVSPKPIVKPVMKPAAQTPAAEEEGSPLPWILGGLGGILLPLFGWLWWKKRKISQETDAESMFRNYSTMRNSDTLGPYSGARKGGAGASGGDSSSFLNDFKASDFESFESFNVDHGDIDPLAEADVYLAYGRYQQAEDLLRQAIKDYPDRDDCKLKLLEIFHASSNKEDFEKYAGELASQGKKEDRDFWSKATELSKDICPDSAIFSALAASTAAVFSTDSEELTENDLLAPFSEQETSPKAFDTQESQGTATFEISDIDQGEALFDTSPPTEIPAQPVVEHEPVKPVSESPGEAEIDLGSLEDDISEFQDNESLDFDLGPYPGSDKSEPQGGLVAETKSVGSGGGVSTSNLAGSDAKTEFESYDFDFTSGITETDKPLIEGNTTKESWDLDNTLEFSFDKPAETEAFTNDTLDFGFDLETPQTESVGDRTAAKNPGFGVSDLTDMDEIETKLDLAKAYIDMGDAGAAKEIIEQIIETGSAEQKKTAQMLLAELS